LDTFTGGSGADTFIAVEAANVAGGDTWNVADTLDGGAGVDALTITSDQTGALAAATVSNIETVTIRTTAAEDATNESIDASNFAGMTTLTLDRVTDNFDVTNLSTATTVNVSKNTGTAADVSLTYASVTGVTDAAVVGIAGFDATSDLTIADGIETLTINQTGTASTIAALDHGANATALNLSATTTALVITEADAGADNTVKTITVTGDAAVTITNALGTAVTRIDGSANTGGTSVTLAGLAAAVTFTGGSAADTLTAINTNANTIDMGAGDDSVTLAAVVASATGTLNGGAGNDTLIFGDASTTLITTANKASITNFEVLRTEVSTDTVDFEALATFTSVVLGASTALTLNNVSTAATASVAVVGDQTTSLIFNIKDATSVGQANSLTLALDHATALTDIDITDFQSDGLETLTITSNGAALTASQNSIELGTETNDLTTINISGSSDFGLTIQGGADLAGQQSILASTFTGILTVDFTGDTEGFALTSGSGADVITTGIGSDIIDGGAGNDTINFANNANGGDTLTGGAGSDAFVNMNTTAGTAAVHTIKDFDFGTASSTADTLSLSIAAIQGLTVATNLSDTSSNDAGAGDGTIVTLTADAATVANADLVILNVNYSDTTTLLAGLKTAGSSTITFGADLADNDVFLVAYSDGTDGYIAVIAASGVATTSETTDSATNLIKLTGVTSFANFDSGDFSITA
jgi:hypothetical protein